MAADLSLAGYEVNLFELPEFEKNIKEILELGGIEIGGGARTGIARFNKVTTKIKEAIDSNNDGIMDDFYYFNGDLIEKEEIDTNYDKNVLPFQKYHYNPNHFFEGKLCHLFYVLLNQFFHHHFHLL